MQKLTDRYIAEIDKLLQQKEADLMARVGQGPHAHATPRCTSSAARPQTIPQTGAVPRHVAIIMDGNGRWAKKRLLPRVAGHRRGVEAVRATVRACGERGVEYLTLFAFSSENWRRPADEVSILMELFLRALEQEVEQAARERHPLQGRRRPRAVRRRASAS